MTFRDALLAEIVEQKARIKRMDFPPNTEMWGNGIMTDIRAERLQLLERLLEFEREPASALETGLACDHNGKILGHRLTCAINQQKACDCDIGPRRVPACSTCGVEPCVCHERAALNRKVNHD